MIDLTKPVYMDGKEVGDIHLYRTEISGVFLYSAVTHKKWSWLPDGTSLGDWPPLTNDPPVRKEFQDMMDALHEIDKDPEEPQEYGYGLNSSEGFEFNNLHEIEERFPHPRTGRGSEGVDRNGSLAYRRYDTWGGVGR
jgi:hypothetical protein